MIAIIILLILILIGILSTNFWLIGILGIIVKKNGLPSKREILQSLEKLQ
jgi:hypothetical protein